MNLIATHCFNFLIKSDKNELRAKNTQVILDSFKMTSDVGEGVQYDHKNPNFTVQTNLETFLKEHKNKEIVFID